MSKQSRINKTYLKAAGNNDVAALEKALTETRHSWWDAELLPRAELMARNGNGYTALMLAAEGGHLHMVRHLLDKAEFDAKACNNHGASALHLAATTGQIDVVTALLDAGLDPNQGDKNGDTPLHYAARGGNTAVIEVLAQRGADINKRNNLGRSAFFMAVEHQKPGTLKTLVACGADPDMMDSAGATPLSHAIHRPGEGYANRTQALAALAAGANPMVIPAKGTRPIEIRYVQKAYQAMKDEGALPVVKVAQPVQTTAKPRHSMPEIVTAPALRLKKVESAPDVSPQNISALTQAFINEGLNPQQDEQWRTLGTSAIEHIIGNTGNPRVIMTTFNFAARQTMSQTRNMLTGEVTAMAADAMDDHPNPAYIEQAHAELAKTRLKTRQPCGPTVRPTASENCNCTRKIRKYYVIQPH